MPTPDASQITQFKKYSAAAAIAAQAQGQKRSITSTSIRLPSVSNPVKFLASFSNKYGDGFSIGNMNSGSVNLFDLSNYKVGSDGLYRINLSQYFSTTEGSIASNTQAVTESTLNPKSYFIYKFSDRNYQYGYAYTFSTISSNTDSEMDLYIGKTSTKLTREDIISCINDTTDTGPAPTSNIKSTWISGGQAFPNNSYTVRDFLRANNTVEIVALNYNSVTLANFILTVKVEVPAYNETSVTNSSFTGNEAIFTNKQITNNSPLPYYSENAHFFNLNSLDNTYTYTFETTAAALSSMITNDTYMILFNTQTKSQLNSLNSENSNDDFGSTNLSKISDVSIGNSWCLTVSAPSTSGDYVTGTFTLKITRTLRVVQDTTTETTVTNSSFSNDEVIFNKQILNTSPFSYFHGNQTNRYGHYFLLNSLSADYTYTFEVTAATLPAGIAGSTQDTLIALFGTQNKTIINSQGYSINASNIDDNGLTTSAYLSKLSNKVLSTSSCLVVTSYTQQQTGTFTLKITRTLK